MGGISTHHSTNSTKLLLVGDSGTGKTGALVSLVLAGFKLRIVDLDNGLDILRSYLTHPASPYAKALAKVDVESACQFVTITEKMRSVQGKPVPAAATVWPKTMNLLTQWKDGDIDLGKPGDWDTDTIVVLDSMSPLSDGALNFQQSLNGQLGTDISSKGYEMRSDIRLAQGHVRRMLDWLCADSFKPNVIVTAHINFQNPPGQDQDSTLGQRGYVNSVGAKLGPQIPRKFNNVLQCITEGSGQSEKHKITSLSYGGVNAKTSAPCSVKPFYGIENGLAEFFHDVRS